MMKALNSKASQAADRESTACLDEAEKFSMLVVEQNASLALDRGHLIETRPPGTADHLRNDKNVRRAYLGC